jgi:hypothetical protein
MQHSRARISLAATSFAATLFPATLFPAALAVLTACLRCGGDADPVSCRDLGNQASLARQDIQDNGDRRCAEDTDCVVVSYGVRCFEDCGVEAAVASSAVASVEAGVEAAEERYCGRFDALNCPPPIPPPCDASDAPRAACQDGQCQLVYMPE